jgi:tetratricopeptide (TPR) repeat protein
MRNMRGISIWSLLWSLTSAAVLVGGIEQRTAWAQSSDPAILGPESAELFQAGLTAQQNHDLPTAERDYSLLLARFPEFLPARFNLGLVFDEERKPQDALNQFLIVRDRKPTFPGVQLFTGVESFRLGKYADAEATLQLATEQAPNDARGWFWLAKTEFTISHSSDARAALETALRHAPQDPSSLYLLALIDISDQDLARSEGVLSGLVGKYPQVPEFHESLGNVYYMQAQLDKAQVEYKSELAISPHNSHALSMLGVILLDRAQASEAIPYLQEGVTANPQVSFLQRKLGQALFEVGRLQDAIPHLRQAITIDPQEATAHFLLWRIYTMQHRPQDAANELAAFRGLQSMQQNTGSKAQLGVMPLNK